MFTAEAENAWWNAVRNQNHVVMLQLASRAKAPARRALGSSTHRSLGVSERQAFEQGNLPGDKPWLLQPIRRLSSLARPKTAGSVPLTIPRGEPAIVNSEKRRTKETALNWCAERGRVDTISTLLTLNADVHSKTHTGMTPLHSAAKGGNVRCCSMLIEAGANSFSMNIAGETPLAVAARFGRASACHALAQAVQRSEPEKLRTLLESKNHGGETALVQAARRGHGDVVKVLVEAGASVAVTTERRTRDGFRLDGRSALWWATQNGHSNVIKILVQAGANTHSADVYAWSQALKPSSDTLQQLLCSGTAEERGGPLVHAISQAIDDERPDYACTMIRNLGKDGGIVSRLNAAISDTNPDTVVVQATKKAQASVVTALLRAGVDPDQPSHDPDRAGPLHAAAHLGDTTISQLLIEAGADICSLDAHGRSPLHMGASAGHAALVEQLLASVADVGQLADICDGQGENAICKVMRRAASASTDPAFSMSACEDIISALVPVTTMSRGIVDRLKGEITKRDDEIRLLKKKLMLTRMRFEEELMLVREEERRVQEAGSQILTFLQTYIDRRPMRNDDAMTLRQVLADAGVRFASLVTPEEAGGTEKKKKPPKRKVLAQRAKEQLLQLIAGNAATLQSY